MLCVITTNPHPSVGQPRQVTLAGFFTAKTGTRYHYVTIWLLCKNKKPVKPHK